jgi:hypothetical protein
MIPGCVEVRRSIGMGDTGPRRSASTAGNNHVSEKAGSLLGTSDHENGDLDRLVAMWPTLPDKTRRAIMRLIGE